MNPATPTSTVTTATVKETPDERRAERARDDAFGAFFWILFAALAVAIVATYLF